jgi:DNA mismatch repair protein MutS
MSETAASKPMKGQTPLMRQYFAIKKQHPGTILLFRMGDFYETFGDDAREAHKVLGITLTKRSNGAASDVALAGFPYHSLDTYLPKLVRAGYRVAICEQVEDPKTAKSIVRRDVVEIVTPGVALRDNLLTPKQSTFVAAVHIGKGARSDDGPMAGVAFADASTGEFKLAEVPEASLASFLASVSPAEILCIKSRIATVQKAGFERAVITPLEEWVFALDQARETLTDHFQTHSLKGFGVEDHQLGIVAAGALLHYLRETQKGLLPHMQRLEVYESHAYMMLDRQTRRNLELVSSMHAGEEGSLVSIMDRTLSPMGGRMLRQWLVRPLRDLTAIQRRQDAVGELVTARSLRADLRQLLRPMGDLERMVARVCTGRASPRDVSGLREALLQIPPLRKGLDQAAAYALHAIAEGLEPCPDVVELVSRALVDEPPAQLKDGGVIRSGYHAELDELRSIATGGKDWLAGLQKSESERTGITSLKIGFNKVFGYYLEVTNAHKDKVPTEWIRKQTLVNAERYITEELKEYEEKILGAEDRLVQLEAVLFAEIREHVASFASVLQANAQLIATLDVLCSFAETAVEERHVCPEMHDGSDLEIEDGRHPVVEHALPTGEPFIPNSVRMNADQEQILLVTGPNMAGKSVVLRQTGLIVLLAQVGAFVPAKRARIGIVDRIFTRVGASDNLAAGESTFLVEMNETANILNNASAKSLILLDEVGRGTSTFDGLSIAWALVEYLHNTPRVAARTMFATHYHELNVLENLLDRVKSYRIQVQEHDGRVIFLRKMVPGGADHSYGIEVARMAGLPGPLLKRSRVILNELENMRTAAAPLAAEPQMNLFAPRPGYPSGASSAQQPMTPEEEDVLEILRRFDVEMTTPLEALQRLAELKKKLTES